MNDWTPTAYVPQKLSPIPTDLFKVRSTLTSGAAILSATLEGQSPWE